MNQSVFKILLLFIVSMSPLFLRAQDNDCVVKNLVHADGTMYYYIEPDTLYFTNAKQLKGGIITDKENYFITLYPFPVPTAVGSLKKYEPLELTLKNKQIESLEFYDARFMNDSTFVLWYLLDVKKNKLLFENEVEQVKITSPDSTLVYKLKLHKDGFLRHFNCLKANIKKI